MSNPECAATNVSWRLINCVTEVGSYKEFLPLLLSHSSMSLLHSPSLPHKHKQETGHAAQTFCTHIISCDDQLNYILGVLVQDLHCGSRYESCKILCKRRNRRQRELLKCKERNDKSMCA